MVNGKTTRKAPKKGKNGKKPASFRKAIANMFNASLNSAKKEFTPLLEEQKKKFLAMIEAQQNRVFAHFDLTAAERQDLMKKAKTWAGSLRDTTIDLGAAFYEMIEKEVAAIKARRKK